MPEGTLTPNQHQIMQVVWGARRAGISASQIWKQVCETRDVGRTTILNQIDRLEQRGWLERREPDADAAKRNILFFSTVGPRSARAQMLQCFVNDYYEGSPKELAKSLLRWRCLSIGDMGELRDFLQQRIDSAEAKIKIAGEQAKSCATNT